MEDLNKLRNYLKQGDEIYVESDNESDNSSDPLNIHEQNSETQKENQYADLSFDEITIIDKCSDPSLKNALILNRKKKTALKKLENRIRSHLLSIREQLVNYRTNTIKTPKKYTKFRLGMPYFKDKDMYICPYNADYYKMKQNGEMPFQSYFIPRHWTVKDKDKLSIAVYTEICKKQKLHLENTIKRQDTENPSYQQELKLLNNESLIRTISSSWSSAKLLTESEVEDRKCEIKKNISELQTQIIYAEADRKKKLMENLVNFIKELDEVEARNYIIKLAAEWNQRIDWLCISCSNLDNRHNDVECYFLWENYMNPKNSKLPWTEADNAKLLAVVQQNEMQNWDFIAYELNLNRSAYQCCIHFFSKLSETKRVRWTSDEETLLQSVINMCRIGDYIPWCKVVKYFPTRTTKQVHWHYMTTMRRDIKKGKFSIAEDILMNALMKKYKSFVITSYYFSNRKIEQVRDRYHGLHGTNRQWTVEDDVAILKHVKQHGDKNWRNVGIKDKNTHMVRHRYNRLKKWIIQHPGQSIENGYRRSRTYKKFIETQLKQNVSSQISDILLKQVDEGYNPREIFNITYIEELLKTLGLNNLDSGKIKIVKPKTKVTKNGIGMCIREFFQYTYTKQSPGRTKCIFSDECVDKAAEQINVLLKMLNVNLKIPDMDILQEHPFLDKYDLRILARLNSATSSNLVVQSTSIDDQPGPSCSTSKETIHTSLVRFNQYNNSQSKASLIKLYLPPEPNLLIGFRSLMLHLPILKNCSLGNIEINKHLPTEEQIISAKHIGLKEIKHLMAIERENLGDNITKVLEERELAQKRFQSLFKWAAIMTNPYNKPQENPFLSNPGELSDSSDIEDVSLGQSQVKQEVKKGKGRPKKSNKKVELMLAAKKRKYMEKLENDSKKIKTT